MRQEINGDFKMSEFVIPPSEKKTFKRASLRTMKRRAVKSLCPFCKGKDVNYHCVEIDAGEGIQQANCPDCETEYVERYRLASIEVAE